MDGSRQVGHLKSCTAADQTWQLRFINKLESKREATEGIGGISIRLFHHPQRGRPGKTGCGGASGFIREMLTSNEILSTFIKTEVTALI